MSEIYFHRGVAYNRIDMPNKARYWYEKAEDLNPFDTRLIFNMAVLYDKMQKYDDALKYYGVFLDKRFSKHLSQQDRVDVEDRIRIVRLYIDKRHEGVKPGTENKI